MNARSDLLSSAEFKCSVSSVLNKDVKQNGKQFMFDAAEDSAWSSSEGTPQWIRLHFTEPQAIKGFAFQFQGGFVGNNATITLEAADGQIICEEPFYPEDINSVQYFNFQTPIKEKQALKVKVVFGGSTDFFGRIIVYKLKLF